LRLLPPSTRTPKRNSRERTQSSQGEEQVGGLGRTEFSPACFGVFETFGFASFAFSRGPFRNPPSIFVRPESLGRPFPFPTQPPKRAATHHKRGADGALPSAATISRRARQVPGQPTQTWLRRFKSVPAPRSLRVASIAAMQRSLKPQSTGRHRGGPPLPTRNAETGTRNKPPTTVSVPRSAIRAPRSLRRHGSVATAAAL
jgi:hypothetical protein